MADPHIQAATHIPGYEILSELGRGGVSTVYLARHELLEREVAIKVMSPALCAEEGFSRRFIREGQTIARLDHPGIVTVFDVSVADHRPYIAMEYLPGGSLKDRMKQSIPPEEALPLLRTIADSLGYAHGRGVCHRDVKPENILFRGNGEPVLTDFGIAKSDSQDTALTSVGVVVGTPRYISPEQAQGEGCDARSDIYALGVILYEMLTGKPPYEGKGSMSLLYAHINDPIPRLPETLACYQDLVDDLLAKNPERRIQDCVNLTARLDDVTGEQAQGDKTRKTPVPLRLGRLPWYRRPGSRLAALSTIAVTLLAYLLWSQGYLPGSERAGGDFKSTVTGLMQDEVKPVEVEDAAAPEAPPGDDQQPLDDGEAAELFERAETLFTGTGAQRDHAAAVTLYRRVASTGHAQARFRLGLAYGNGRGVDLDEAQAVEWLSRAAQAGVPEARYNLVLAKVFGPAPDPDEAVRLALDLGEDGYTPVYRILGWMYNTGTGVDPSLTQSVRWSVKTMVGDWTGKARAPTRVVERWERRLREELEKLRTEMPEPK